MIYTLIFIGKLRVLAPGGKPNRCCHAKKCMQVSRGILRRMGFENQPSASRMIFPGGHVPLHDASAFTDLPHYPRPFSGYPYLNCRNQISFRRNRGSAWTLRSSN